MRGMTQKGAGLRGLIIFAVLLAACSSSPRVITNSDPEANFAEFQTFGFMRPLSTDRLGATSIMSPHLIAATTNELEKAGMQRDDSDPDLLINFLVTTKEVIRASSSPTAGVSMHHRMGHYNTWGGYNIGMSTAQVSQTTEGTLSVDIVDSTRNQLVWEGAATSRLSESMRDNLDESIHDAIGHIFRQFP